MNGLNWDIESEEITLYAHWERETYTIYLMEGNSVYDTIQVQYGGVVNYERNREHYKFIGIYSGKNQTGTRYVHSELKYELLDYKTNLYGYRLAYISDNQTWDELWNSEQAEKVRNKVRHCDRQCWMIGSVSPAMHKYIWKPAWWVIRHKFLRFFKKEKYSMFENKIVKDYKEGKVSKEELDKCSTCDMNCTINDGLSEASREQLKDKTGEEIVDEDLKRQMKR